METRNNTRPVTARDAALQHPRTGLSGGDDPRTDQAVTRGSEIEIIVDGHALRAFQGESVAAALLAAGKRELRTTSRRGQPRGLYCGIGICFDCVMTIDGQPSVRACQTQVRPGMRIETQSGEGTWTVEP
jgi:hypothetical protein